MKPIAPNSQISVMQILLSFYKVFLSNVGFGSAATVDSSGVPLDYNADNTNGCMIRVGNVTSTGIAQKWVASATDTLINHSLNRIPIGYLVFRKSGPVQVYSGTAPWTDSQICLQTSDDTIDTHIYIF